MRDPAVRSNPSGGVIAVAAFALAVCCGAPVLASTAAGAGLVVWLVGGGVLAGAILAGGLLLMVLVRQRRRCRTDAPKAR